MKTFKNTSGAKYDGECTLVMFVQAETAPASGQWTECDALEIELTPFVTPLWTQGGVQYFGRL